MPTSTVIIDFSPEVAEEIRARRWSAVQTLIPSPDGGVRLEMDPALPGLLRWVLQWGSHAYVIAPRALRAEVAHELAAALSQYDLEDA